MQISMVEYLKTAASDPRFAAGAGAVAGGAAGALAANPGLLNAPKAMAAQGVDAVQQGYHAALSHMSEAAGALKHLASQGVDWAETALQHLGQGAQAIAADLGAAAKISMVQYLKQAAGPSATQMGLAGSAGLGAGFLASRPDLLEAPIRASAPAMQHPGDTLQNVAQSAYTNMQQAMHYLQGLAQQGVGLANEALQHTMRGFDVMGQMTGNVGSVIQHGAGNVGSAIQQGAGNVGAALQHGAGDIGSSISSLFKGGSISMAAYLKHAEITPRGMFAAGIPLAALGAGGAAGMMTRGMGPGLFAGPAVPGPGPSVPNHPFLGTHFGTPTPEGMAAGYASPRPAWVDNPSNNPLLQPPVPPAHMTPSGSDPFAVQPYDYSSFGLPSAPGTEDLGEVPDLSIEPEAMSEGFGDPEAMSSILRDMIQSRA